MSREKNTIMLLRSISDHLSSRRDCKGVEYEVDVSINKDEHGIAFIEFSMSPVTYVYPNPKRRKPEDRVNVLYHVLTQHFQILLQEIDLAGTVKVQPGRIIPGKYIYRLSVNGKQRRWCKDNHILKV